MKVLCPECGDQEVFKIGTSFLDSKYNLLNLKSDHCIIHFIEEEKDKEKIKSIIKHGGEIANHYGYTLYYCNNCHYLYSKFSFRVGIGKEQYEAHYSCPNCHLDLVEANRNNMITYKCKNCKKDSMIYID